MTAVEQISKKIPRLYFSSKSRWSAKCFGIGVTIENRVQWSLIIQIFHHINKSCQSKKGGMIPTTLSKFLGRKPLIWFHATWTCLLDTVTQQVPYYGLHSVRVCSHFFTHTKVSDKVECVKFNFCKITQFSFIKYFYSDCQSTISCFKTFVIFIFFTFRRLWEIYRDSCAYIFILQYPRISFYIYCSQNVECVKNNFSSQENKTRSDSCT